MLLGVLFLLFSVCDGVSVSTPFYWSVFMFCLNKNNYFAGWLFAANLRLSFYVVMIMYLSKVTKLFKNGVKSTLRPCPHIRRRLPPFSTVGANRHWPKTCGQMSILGLECVDSTIIVKIHCKSRNET